MEEGVSAQLRAHSEPTRPILSGRTVRTRVLIALQEHARNTQELERLQAAYVDRTVCLDSCLLQLLLDGGELCDCPTSPGESKGPACCAALDRARPDERLKFRRRWPRVISPELPLTPISRQLAELDAAVAAAKANIEKSFAENVQPLLKEASDLMAAPLLICDLDKKVARQKQLAQRQQEVLEQLATQQAREWLALRSLTREGRAVEAALC